MKTLSTTSSIIFLTLPGSPHVAGEVAHTRPVIAIWAAKIGHISGVGDGHLMKLLNNFPSLGKAAKSASRSPPPVATIDSVVRGGRMNCGFSRPSWARLWTATARRSASP